MAIYNNRRVLVMLSWSFLVVSLLVTIFKLTIVSYTGLPIPHSFTQAIRIGNALRSYAAKHKGLYPSGKTSTEIFQQLIDDGDAYPSIFFINISGKHAPDDVGAKLKSNNVSFDFIQGTTAASPNWVPIVLPTGFSVNFSSGEIVKLQSSAINDAVITVVYSNGERYWPVANHFNIMPGKPLNANVDYYEQLTP